VPCGLRRPRDRVVSDHAAASGAALCARPRETSRAPVSPRVECVPAPDDDDRHDIDHTTHEPRRVC
jgi:hypothetical protein